MFWNRNKISKEMISNLRPTSKAALKQMCLYSTNGDIDKASKLYDFMIKDMDDLPTFDVQPPSTMEQIKSGISDTMGWLNENQEKLLIWADLVGGIFRRTKGLSSVANKAGDGVQSATNAIPNINQ